MGRVFDFNMSRLCPAGSCAAVRQSRRPRAAIAECAGFRWAIPDKRYTLHCLHLYVTSQSSDTDFGFSAFPGTRVATVGVFPARAVARTPNYVRRRYPYRTIDRAAGTRGHARTHR